MTREKGVVKWFSTEKGYGFIRRETGEEVFVHHTDIDVEGYASLRNGETVEFEIFESDRGPKARKLVSLERDDEAEDSLDSDLPAKPRSRARDEGRRAGSSSGRDDGRRGRKPAGRGALKPLAEQLRERLGDRFPGFGS